MNGDTTTTKKKSRKHGSSLPREAHRDSGRKRCAAGVPDGQQKKAETRGKVMQTILISQSLLDYCSDVMNHFYCTENLQEPRGAPGESASTCGQTTSAAAARSQVRAAHARFICTPLFAIHVFHSSFTQNHTVTSVKPL